jgi:type VI secretion system protein VasG
LCADEDTRPEAGALGEAIRPELLKHFPPAFLGRLMVVPYFRIADTILRQIIHLQLGRIRNRIRANHRAEFAFDEAVVDAIKSRCTEVDSGARNVEHILTRTLLPEISNAVLSRLADDAPIATVRVTADASGTFQYAIN